MTMIKRIIKTVKRSTFARFRGRFWKIYFLLGLDSSNGLIKFGAKKISSVIFSKIHELIYTKNLKKF